VAPVGCWVYNAVTHQSSDTLVCPQSIARAVVRNAHCARRPGGLGTGPAAAEVKFLCSARGRKLVPGMSGTGGQVQSGAEWVTPVSWSYRALAEIRSMQWSSGPVRTGNKIL